MRVPGFERYRWGARWYDLLSLEAVLYRPGRLAAVDALGLRPGARVLDVGCGTGLNLPPVLARVGPSGAVVGVDAAPAMLARARARVRRERWGNVRLVRHDAGDLAAALAGEPPFDAVLFTYSLSIIRSWRSAWRQALGMLAAGGRVAVVDTAVPTGRWWPLWPLARLAMATGGVRPDRRPWTLVTRSAADARDRTLCGGHVRLAVGTPGPPPGPQGR